MTHPEHEQQSIYIGQCKAASSYYPVLAWVAAVPNFRFQSLNTAAYMRREGLRPGIPDVHLPAARGGYNSLWIEFKADKGQLSPTQEIWLEVLASLGSYACVCYTGAFAFDLTLDYIRGNLLKDTITGYWIFSQPERFVPVTRNLVQLYDAYELALATTRASKRKKGHYVKSH